MMPELACAVTVVTRPGPAGGHRVRDQQDDSRASTWARMRRQCEPSQKMRPHESQVLKR
jgi:hypothetical protein